jgi:hypothetical protein
MKKLIAASLLAIMLVAAGCKDKAPAVLKPALLDREPIIDSYADKDIDLSSYRLFSFAPYELFYEGVPFGNKLIEKDVQRNVRNTMESKGYVYISDYKQADIIFVVYGNSKYDTYQTPDKSIELPVYIPGENATITSNNGESARVTTQGKWTTRTYTRSGRTKGYNGIYLSLRAFNRATITEAWNSSAYGESSNRDIRVSSQRLLLGMLGRFPDSHMKSVAPSIGIEYHCYTADGQHTQPLVTGITKKTLPVKPLDLIVTINGKPTVDLYWNEIYLNLLECKYVEVLRGNKLIKLSISE